MCSIKNTTTTDTQSYMDAIKICIIAEQIETHIKNLQDQTKTTPRKSTARGTSSKPQADTVGTICKKINKFNHFAIKCRSRTLYKWSIGAKPVGL